MRGNRDYSFSLEPVTQLCGMNILEKDYIIRSLGMHFSNSKYTEYQDVAENNVKLDSADVGRQFFTTVIIKDRDSLIESLKYAKKSRMKIYLDNILNSVDLSPIVSNIEAALVDIEQIITQEWEKSDSKLRLTFSTEDVIDIVASADVTSEYGRLELLTNIQLLKEVIRLVQATQKIVDEKVLFIIQNADHFLSLEEYRELIKYLADASMETNIYFLITTSLEKYVFLDKELLSGVAVLNDVLISFPEYDELEVFISENYPTDKRISLVELFRLMEAEIQEYGLDIVEKDIRSDIVKMLINNSEGVKEVKYSNVSLPEKAFLFGE